MMKKSLFTFYFLFASIYILKAALVPESVAKQAAKNHFWKHSQAVAYSEISPVLAYTELHNGSPLFYIFDINDHKGFVIVSAEDNAYPVWGYSFMYNFSDQKDNLAPNFKDWIDHYAEQIINIRENKLQADDAILLAWADLATYNPSPDVLDNVDPLTNTSWDQGCYYNALCPSDNGGPCNHVYVGCVATAMGQIMKFHNYPEQGVGTHTYFCYPYGNQTADFGATTYEWSSMPNQVNSSNNAVATLLYHCGVSVNMQYSASGSGAYSNTARDAFKNYFAYSTDAELVSKANYTSTQWEAMLKNDLDNGFPLYYAGYGSGGHAFVCDGYQGTNYFHFNWGWSGWFNGYFYVNNLNPGGNNFNQNQEAILHIYPPGSSTLVPPANLQADLVNGNDVDLSWDEPSSGEEVSGYNIFRNNENIGYTVQTEFTDLDLDAGTYEYYVTAVYDVGESLGSNAVSVLVGGNNITVFDDDFEAISAGSQLACQNPDEWTTWSNAPCGSEDPYISSDQAFSGSNSVIIEGTNDLVRTIPNYNSGLYKISFMIYVPDGFLGYFNTLQDFDGSNSLWGMQVYFNEDGTGGIDGGGTGAAAFTYTQDTWMLNEVIVDLNNDWAEYKLDGNSIHSWTWSAGALGQSGINQLGGSNFFAWTGNKGTPKYYIDNYSIVEVSNELLPAPFNLQADVTADGIQLAWSIETGGSPLGYNIYHSLDGGEFDLLDYFTGIQPYVHNDPGLGLHAYYVTAVYNEGESLPSNTVDILLTSVDEVKYSEPEIYPNPASNHITINSAMEMKSVKIFDLTGKEILNEKIGGIKGELDVSDLETGIYFIRIVTGKNNFCKRIIIH